jgi:hypothetical protein
MPLLFLRWAAATPSCLIPGFDGVIHSLEWKEAIWDRFVTSDRMRSLATTTHAVRAALQRSQASLATLSRFSGRDPWRSIVSPRRRDSLEPRLDLTLGASLTEGSDAECGSLRLLSHSLLLTS